VNPDGVCKGCAQGKNMKNPFPSSDNREKDSWILYTQMYVNRCQHHHSMSKYIMYLLMMITHAKLGFTS
jgi:hypothetical protein